MRPKLRGTMNISRALIVPAAAMGLYFACGAYQAGAQTRYTSKIVSSSQTPMCLAVRGGIFQNGNTLMTWDCLPNDPSQTFYPTGQYIRVGDSNSPFCVTALDGLANMSRVGISGCNLSNGRIGETQAFF